MPRRKAGATQATQNADDEEENFGAAEMDLDDDEEEAPARRKKGTASRKSGTTAATGLSSDDIDKKARDLCRLALFTEYRRTVLKREDINKKVMGGNTKAFPEVLAKANKRLKAALGYEIVELMSRADREKTLLGGMEEDEEPKKKVSAKQYIVRSTLDPELILLASTVDEHIQTQEEEDAADPEATVSGCILAWQTHDQIPAYGILCVILSLILVNGKTIPDPSLRSQLKKLRLTSTSIIEVGSVNAPKRSTLEQYLTLAIKQGYLDRVNIGNAAGARTGATKRGRGGNNAVRADGEEGAVDIEWRWGERAHAEISEQGISDFVVAFMTDQSRPAGNVAESERAKKERREKVRKQLNTDILKAAQAPLTKIGREDDA
ncbi:hypothetical protein M408DRAFT_327538 [Serendipita vermifera MAFF 305830]|uniref:MAGE domain-containing protein n=1 Tax=Serendipita vermifera MAFF 305830 TaxID=933852 RepID=A0A0C2XQP1_SERVB|nr:hypothetical protein M408DRAFT_327538 [Serendipita vermifera MAFF 305830]